MTELTSPPSRGRGLKQEQIDVAETAAEVAPFAGAWIETKIRGHA